MSILYSNKELGRLGISCFSVSCNNTNYVVSRAKAAGKTCFNHVLPCDLTDFCGPPKTIPHASLSLKGQYYVGQVLHFKCQRGYDKQTPTSGTSTCMKVNGEITWTPLAMQCTNDSSYSDESLQQTIEPGKVVALASHQCHDLLMQGPEPHQLSTSALGKNLLEVRDGEINGLRTLTLMEMSSLIDGGDISGENIAASYFVLDVLSY